MFVELEELLEDRDLKTALEDQTQEFMSTIEEDDSIEAMMLSMEGVSTLK